MSRHVSRRAGIWKKTGLTRAIPIAHTRPLAVVRLYLLHRLSSVGLAVVADRLGDAAVVTDERGRIGYAAGQDEQGRQRQQRLQPWQHLHQVAPGLPDALASATWRFPIR